MSIRAFVLHGVFRVLLISAAFVVGFGLVIRGAELADHGWGERVERVGPVQRDRGLVPVDVVLDVGHLVTFHRIPVCAFHGMPPSPL